MLILIMGVSGCGKTTVGSALAEKIGARFLDADDFHTESNIAKMRRGDPLTEVDRGPWLRRLRSVIDECLAERETAVLACSALTKASRDVLGTDRNGIEIVFLHGSKTLIEERIQQRNHFMPASLLESQLLLLEPPTGALGLEITASPDELVAVIRSHFAVES